MKSLNAPGADGQLDGASSMFGPVLYTFAVRTTEGQMLRASANGSGGMGPGLFRTGFGSGSLPHSQFQCRPWRTD